MQKCRVQSRLKRTHALQIPPKLVSQRQIFADFELPNVHVHASTCAHCTHFHLLVISQIEAIAKISRGRKFVHLHEISTKLSHSVDRADDFH